MIWTDVASLNWGSDRQRDAYQALIALDIFSVLADYDPVLVGAYPLGLERPGSDLALICHAPSLDGFVSLMLAAYGDMDEFQVLRSEQAGLPVAICGFQYREFPVVVAAQPLPSEEQAAYQHMVAEAALLRMDGEEARAAVRERMEEGLALDAAFVQYFCLKGKADDALLRVADMGAGEVQEVVLSARYLRRGTGLPFEPVNEVPVNEVPVNEVPVNEVPVSEAW